MGWWGLALVALGKEPKSIDLFDEVVHASPPSKAEANYEDPDDYKCIYHIHSWPAWEEEWGLLCCILHLRKLD